MDANPYDLVQSQRSAARVLGERLAGHVLHHDVRAIVDLEHVEHGGDARIVQLRSRAGFANDPADVGGDSVCTRQHFDVHLTLELCFELEIYFTNIAFPQRPLEDVRTYAVLLTEIITGRYSIV